jgi:alpha-beta hydrolase superfamily lysophospholipase
VPPPPVVIVFGGADGWREEYHNGALALRERGLAVLLLDGPGQGETRLLGGLHLRPDTVASAHAAVVHFLIEDQRVGRSVGIWGNSLGGTLAARAASACPEIVACCVNGGSAEPERAIDRLPRLADRLRALTGDADAASVRASLAALALPAEVNRITCPLLLLHGGADALFAPDEALAIAQNASSSDKTVLFWDDGDHCIYNHSHEKHCAVADWFLDRLKARSRGSGQN